MNFAGTYSDIVEIGSGGGGTVYRAYHVRMQKYVVLKKIHDNLSNRVDIRAELDILKNLRHSYLPTVLDLFVDDQGSVYTVMDYIPGASFKDLMTQGRRFSPNQVAKYAKQLAEVLDYLHSQKVPIIHGDIKPANIMLTPDDNICLIDFNISQVQNNAQVSNLGYTPGYASPEQVQITMNAKAAVQNGVPMEQLRIQPLDAQSDIYSAGATLYALLAGKSPTKDFSQLVPIEEVVDLSEGLAFVIDKAMEFYPKDRFASARDMLAAVDGIAKVDNRYKRMILRQVIKMIASMIGMALSVIVMILGFQTMKKEGQENYAALIDEMQKIREDNGSREEFDEVYNEAIGLDATYADAYIEKSKYLHDGLQYEETIDYCLNNALENSKDFSDDEIGFLYYVVGESYYSEDDIKNAIVYYKTAIQYNEHESIYYSDYAVALATDGQYEKAEDTLQDAIDLGLSDDKIMLVKGEIAKAQKDIDEGEACFAACIEKTSDDYNLLRAYVMWSKLYINDDYDNGVSDSPDMIQKRIDVLEEAQGAVIADYKSMVLELLAQAYIDMGDATSNPSYYAKAVDRLDEIVQMGWDGYQTHTTIGILHEKLGEYDQAFDEFNQMLTDYGEDYRTYKRLALLELEIQNAKPNAERDYSAFKEYYDKACELAAANKNSTETDPEMLRLDQYYSELQSGGWFN